MLAKELTSPPPPSPSSNKRDKFRKGAEAGNYIVIANVWFEPDFAKQPDVKTNFVTTGVPACSYQHTQ